MYRILIIGMILLVGCDGEELPAAEDSYEFSAPKNFPVAAYTFEKNPVTRGGFALGRALFYDPVLSGDSSIACANCHQQVKGFSDPVHRFSRGVGDVAGIRNAPAIQNMAFQNTFFWDGGVKHLDFVPINAITSEFEMHESLSHVVEKLKRSEFFPEKFSKAFGSEEVTSQKMLFALSQFMNMMISSNSRYDLYIRNEGEVLTPDEVEGLALFLSKCSACHATDLFTDETFRNNGISDDFSADTGRERITESPEDRGKFKVPSLRNVALTAPYMHDGRFRTLKDVLEHYATSIKDSETLDPMLKQGITMSDDEKDKIIAFLKTLTDDTYIKDKRFTNPFLK